MSKIVHSFEQVLFVGVSGSSQLNFSLNATWNPTGFPYFIAALRLEKCPSELVLFVGVSGSSPLNFSFSATWNPTGCPYFIAALRLEVGADFIINKRNRLTPWVCVVPSRVTPWSLARHRDIKTRAGNKHRPPVPAPTRVGGRDHGVGASGSSLGRPLARVGHRDEAFDNKPPLTRLFFSPTVQSSSKMSFRGKSDKNRELETLELRPIQDGQFLGLRRSRKGPPGLSSSLTPPATHKGKAGEAEERRD
ncbi:hypothetical protein C7M84_000647 [Penaeus vannamei]|uniref:Uncharacterized protein n=1 Tax=Penaeus vannamei TaxID=6689 RepID=A0A423TVW8_PENVA|nr:hypothetical protein C7M84_000647 [Penaeus vannamei]